VQYREKTKSIEAHKWDGNADRLREWVQKHGPFGSGYYLFLDVSTENILFLKTPHSGFVMLDLESYICFNPIGGGLSVIDNTTFTNKYERE